MSTPRRRRLAAVSAAAVAVALVGAGCTEDVAGRGQPASPPPVTASGATYLAVLALAGAGAVHYQGAVSAPGLDSVGVDLQVTSGGAATGTVSYRGKAATMLVANRTAYLRAAQDYWTTLGQNKDLARRYADRWIKAPPSAFGVDLGSVLRPATLAEQLQDGLDAVRTKRLAELPTATVQGVRAAKVATADATYFVSVAQPYRLLRLETPSQPRLKSGPLPPGTGRRQPNVVPPSVVPPSLASPPRVPPSLVPPRLVPPRLVPPRLVPPRLVPPRLVPSKPGPNDLTDIALDVIDVTTDQAGIYQRVRRQAGQLGKAIDGQVPLLQGAQGFVRCGPASCTLQVTFTNASAVPVRAQLHADWTGDGAPIGGCDDTAGMLRPHRIGAASCTITSPGWVAFYFKATSTPGDHPYVALWTVVAMAAPPDLRELDQQATAVWCAAADGSGGAVPDNCPKFSPAGAHDAAVRAGYAQLARRFPDAHSYGDVPGCRYGPVVGRAGSRGSTGSLPGPTGFPDLVVLLGGRLYVYQLASATDGAAGLAVTRRRLQGYAQSLRDGLFGPDVSVRYGPPVDPVTVHDPQIDRDVRIFSRPGYPGVILYALA